MKASDLFVEALTSEGVEFVFGIPGEENLDLLESLRKSSIKLVVTRHEQAAGFMAATYGRLTGKAGVCLSTLGPGATNLVTAAAYAKLGAMPLLMVTGQKPIRRGKQGDFQFVDVVDMMRPLTKSTRQIASGHNIPARVREAVRLAEEERPAAVHLELPEDIAREESDVPVIRASYNRRPIAEVKAIQHAVELIEQARRPIMVIGAGANRKRTSKMLREFIDETGIPFVTTQMGKGVVDERKKQFLGTASLSDGDFVHRALDAADVIINVGHDVVEKPPFFMHHNGVTVIHVNFFSAEVAPVYFPQAEVVGDIANSIWQMKEMIRKQPSWEFTCFDKIRGHVEAHIAEGLEDSRFPVYPPRLVAEVRKVMPSSGIIALDNGIYKIWFTRNYKAHEPNTVLADNALATMGAGLPSAMAACLVYPDRRVVAICGDGGFMLNSQELETAVRLGLNLTVLILCDNAFGMIKWKQKALGFADFGLDYSNPDFVKYAESYGASGHRLERIEDLTGVMARAHESQGVQVIEIPVDYSDNDRDLNQEIRERSAALVID